MKTLSYLYWNFVDPYLIKPVENFIFYLRNRNNSRLSSAVLKYYSDDSLSGYGDWEYKKGGTTITEQQRGLILPLLKDSLQGPLKKTVIEIGTGNGDVLAHLREEYPRHDYFGVDFSVRNARMKHPHLIFIKGYALDLLQSKNIKGDLVFASSTFLFFAPRELQAYLIAIKDRGFKEIVLNEPTWGKGREKSRYLERGCWQHDYKKYLEEAGFIVKDFSHFHYRHPISKRPDIFITLIRGVIRQ